MNKTSGSPGFTNPVTNVTLTEFLLARIAEDEALARHMWEERVARRHVGLEVSHRWPTPDRVLAECEAKRRLIDRVTYMADAEDRMGGYADEFLSFLALPYADHPDYREEWRP